MNRMTNLSRAVGMVVVGLLAATAAGQDSQALRELEHSHDKLVPLKAAISVTEAQHALEQIEAWNLPVNKLAKEQRGWLERLTIHAALAAGHAGRADDWLPELERDFTDERETLRAAWLVAVAMGNAQAAMATLEKLKEQDLARPRAIAARQRRLRMVGKAVPDIEVKTEDGRLIALRRRNDAVLVLDFWRLRDQPKERHVAALRALHEAYGNRPTVQFLGVNSDGPDKIEAAQRLATENGYTWPRHYERRTSNAPLRDQAFHVEAAPWQVIVDMQGNVRAVGSAHDPAFQYALRAAVAEAEGRYRALLPRTIAGVEAAARLPKTPAVEPEPKRKEKRVATGDLPSNLEAKRLLDRARVFLKTGLKRDAKKLLEEVVEKYPGTREAREAKEWLSFL